MSLNTAALVQSPPKSGKASEGGGGDNSQNSSRASAAEFQSVLNNVKAEDQTAPEDAGEQAAAREMQPGPDQVKGHGSQANTSEVAFSTSNLTDALRQVSQNILGQNAGGELPLEAGEAEAARFNKEAVDRSASAPIGLTMSTALTLGAGKALPILQVNAQDRLNNSKSLQVAELPMPKSQMAENSKTGTSSLFSQFGMEPKPVGDLSQVKSTGKPLVPEEAAGEVKILRQETHFAPNLRLSPTQQIGNQIASALKDVPMDSTQPQAGVTARSEGPVLKTLEVQLTPHELGTVKVSLRMVGDNVEVALRTSSAQTADLLRQDKQLLDQMLRTTGFKADTITVQAADDRPSIQASNTATGSSASGQNGAGSNASSDGQAQSFSGGNPGERNDQTRRGNDEGLVFAQESLGDENLKGFRDEEGSELNLSDGIYL